jgi:lipopolysaccharide/colanic/teichoic acid biosynthesis glycosyltransferase
MPDGLQRVTAFVLAIASAPLVLALAVVVWIDSRGSPLYLSPRVGEGGRTFRLAKLRTMGNHDAAGWPAISLADDRRVTHVGRALRRWRLDELPQLWNVVRGEMRLVGPRPEDPRFVDLSDELHRRVFTTRPGMTGLAQLVHLDEGATIDPADPERSYRDRVLPAKLEVDAAYLNRRTSGLDLWILVQTLAAVLGHGPDHRTLSRRLGIPLTPPATEQ